MNVPIHWYFFVNYLPEEIKRSGSLENALKNWKKGLPEPVQREMRDFLADAVTRNGDCWTLYCPDIDESLMLVPKRGDTCRAYYGEMLRLFDKH